MGGQPHLPFSPIPALPARTRLVCSAVAVAAAAAAAALSSYTLPFIVRRAEIKRAGAENYEATSIKNGLSYGRGRPSGGVSRPN